jgi:hypothetical protein
MICQEDPTTVGMWCLHVIKLKGQIVQVYRDVIHYRVKLDIGVLKEG